MNVADLEGEGWTEGSFIPAGALHAEDEVEMEVGVDPETGHTKVERWRIKPKPPNLPQTTV